MIYPLLNIPMPFYMESNLRGRRGKDNQDQVRLGSIATSSGFSSSLE